MPRPKRGTAKGDIATLKWRNTMEKRYGGANGVHKMMQEMGRKGGRISNSGGFASNIRGADGLTGKERARVAGAKGGVISKRNSVQIQKIQKNKSEIMSLWYAGVPATRIAEQYGIPCNTLRYFIRKEVNDEDIIGAIR